MTTSTTRWRRASSGWAVALALLAGAAGAHEAPKPKLDFAPPAPGSYRLERIMPAPDGKVLDAERKQANLSAYTHGKVTLLSLMYTACSDAHGCPMAFYGIAAIKRDLEKSKAVGGHVQVVSLSFDPDRDTPEVMRAYGGKHAKAGAPVRWHFLTTGSRKDLAPLLDGFGQDVSKAAKGQASNELLHVLKLFLLDRDGWVREIYTTSYLAPQVVVNDIKTLLLEEGVKVN
jgi:cytochrome oxidase Cu insertion factor (SCO1/SenC/PrrC family)